MIEEWKEIKEFEGNYLVSSFGRVKSVHKIIIRSCGKQHTRVSKILKPAIDGSGYLRCAVSFNGKAITRKIHRIVAIAFVDGMNANRNQVNHIDGNKKNNAVYNLEWVTGSENCKHSFDIGIQKPKRGMQNGSSKLVDSDIPKIRKMFQDGLTSRQIASMYKMDKTIFLDIKNGKCWTHV